MLDVFPLFHKHVLHRQLKIKSTTNHIQLTISVHPPLPSPPRSLVV